jgi:hypothetical protein
VDFIRDTETTIMLRNETPSDEDLESLVALVECDDWDEAVLNAEEVAARRPDLEEAVVVVFRKQWSEEGEREARRIWAAKAPAEQTVIKPQLAKPASYRRAHKAEPEPAAGAGQFRADEVEEPPDGTTKRQSEGPKLERSNEDQIVLVGSAPYDSARIFVEVRYKGGTLRHYQGQFYAYTGKCWRVMDQGVLRQELYKFLDGTVVKAWTSSFTYAKSTATHARLLQSECPWVRL